VAARVLLLAALARAALTWLWRPRPLQFVPPLLLSLLLLSHLARRLLALCLPWQSLPAALIPLQLTLGPSPALQPLTSVWS
jgi:hypothetical protein